MSFKTLPMNLQKRSAMKCFVPPLFAALLFLVGCRPIAPWTVGEGEAVPFLRLQMQSVDSLVLEMSLEEKLGQLVVFRSDSAVWAAGLWEEVAGGHLGGVMLQGLSLEDYVRVTDSLRLASELPLFFGTPARTSLLEQFSGLTSFPQAATLVSVDSTRLREHLLRQYVRQCQGMGINLSFAPVVAPVDAENFRPEGSFEGQDSARLNTAMQYLFALQTEGVLAIGDAFRGPLLLEPDTCGLVDSLFPVLTPLLSNGLSGLLLDPVLLKDSLKRYPQGILPHLFQLHWNYRGLLIAQPESLSEAEDWIYAGADLFLTERPEEVRRLLREAYRKGWLSKTALNEKVRKVLLAKSWAEGGNLLPYKFKKRRDGLPVLQVSRRVHRSFPPPSAMRAPYLQILHDYFHDPAWGLIARVIYERSVILANNPTGAVPFLMLRGKDFHLLQFSKSHFQPFKRTVAKFATFTSYLFPVKEGGELEALQVNNFKWTTPIVLLDGVTLDARKHAAFIESVNKLHLKTPVVLVNFGNPFNLAHFDPTMTLIQCFERNEHTERVAAQIIFGGRRAVGRLPLTVGPTLQFGKRESGDKLRLEFAYPEDVGMASERLASLEAIAASAMAARAMPGCQVVVAKDGKVVYSRGFGYLTYAEERPVKTTDVYDLASVTKVAATTLAAMRLFEEGKWHPDDRLEAHLPLTENAAVGMLTLRELMTHSSGLQSFMPIGRYLSRSAFRADCQRFYCTHEQGPFTVPLSDRLFFNARFQDSIKHDALQVRPRRRGFYRYSDVNFFLLQWVLEGESGKPLDELTEQEFYLPLGLRRTLFRPLRKIHRSEIAPTQAEGGWRGDLLQGYVHDEAAALMGGVAGNAGLFSTAEELTVLFQMLLDGGTYGGRRFLEPETIELFTSAVHGNHRGLGFDKPSRYRAVSAAPSAPLQSFGHTGFTGTCVWADPTENLVFVFLSNRVFPNARNRKLFELGVRRRMHQVVYEALETFQPHIPELDFHQRRG